MDRIYYFRLTQDKNMCAADKLPIFRKVSGGYEIYYLQMHASVGKEQLSIWQAHMAKGIGRIAVWYQEGPWWKEQRSVDTGSEPAYLVYEASFEKWLIENHFSEYWQQLWNLPVYAEYREAHNLHLLLKQIPRQDWPQHLIIVGDAPGIQGWVYTLAKHMKDIQICSETVPRGFETMREELLEEYGLVIRWKKELWPKHSERCMVLDYCGREKVFIWGVPQRSLWIDMTSLEVRRRAIEDRDTGIKYYSLKRFWRQEMVQTLDTIGKIQYNTEVKLEGEADASPGKRENG